MIAGTYYVPRKGTMEKIVHASFNGTDKQLNMVINRISTIMGSFSSMSLETQARILIRMILTADDDQVETITSDETQESSKLIALGKLAELEAITKYLFSYCMSNSYMLISWICRKSESCGIEKYFWKLDETPLSQRSVFNINQSITRDTELMMLQIVSDIKTELDNNTTSLLFDEEEKLYCLLNSCIRIFN